MLAVASLAFIDGDSLIHIRQLFLGCMRETRQCIFLLSWMLPVRL